MIADRSRGATTRRASGNTRDRPIVSYTKEPDVKKDIHPQMNYVEVVCACGNRFWTNSTADELRLEICNACHPFFTGKQKLIDTAGRVERFQRRYGLKKTA